MHLILQAGLCIRDINVQERNTRKANPGMQVPFAMFSFDL
jgi:hypothetical protein